MSEALEKPAGWAPPTLSRVDAVKKAPAKVAAPDTEQLRREAREAGLAEGLAAGRAQSERTAAEMNALLQAMVEPFRDSEAMLLRDLMNLVERVVAAVLEREISQSPSDIEQVLKEALQTLGSVQVPVELTLNPQDAAACRDLGLTIKSGMTMVEDPSIRRGGLKLEAGSSIVDATVEARLEEVLAALRDQAGLPQHDDEDAAADGNPGPAGPA